jgi:alpha-maltose-1-phosphate synthase
VLKILMLCEGDAETRDSWSGVSLSVASQLRALGHQVRTGDVDLYGIERLAAIAGSWSPDRKRWWVRYHLNRGPFQRRSAKAARHYAAHPDVDVILQCGATFSSPEKTRVPIVLFCDGNIEVSWQARHIGNNDAAVLDRSEVDAIRQREEKVYHRAAKIMTFSERLRESFIEDFGISRADVTTVYAGPNFETDKVDQRPPRGPNAVPTILFVGRQFARKGGDLLLRAFRLVRESIPNARLVIVGPSTPIEAEGVDFRGLINKQDPEGERLLLTLYHDADVFCMPSRYEGFAISFLEAMLFGLPCVSTRPPWSPPEMILDGETGYLVESEDAEALASRLVQLLSDRDEAQRMGEKGRERVLANFTWPAVGKRIERVLLEAHRASVLRKGVRQ